MARQPAMAAYLRPWRWAAGTLLVLVVGLPLALPCLELAGLGWRSRVQNDSRGTEHAIVPPTAPGSGGVPLNPSLPFLLGQTTILIAGVLGLAMPIGIVLAVLLFRTEFPGRRILLALTFLLLFVPLPTYTSAWQAAFGADGWLPVHFFAGKPGRPWTTGMGPAIWIHFLAVLPWVILFVGLALTWVEREVEEDGLLLGPPWWVLLRVTLPRCLPAIGFAAVWLALQVAGEISVTDMMLVPTFAEDVQTQFTTSDRTAVARAVASALPVALVAWLLLVLCMTRWHSRLPPLQTRLVPPRRFSWGRWRWLVALLATILFAFFFATPFGSLIWKLGQAGHPPHWSDNDAVHHLTNAARVHAEVVATSVLTAAAAGAFAALFAVVLCWVADESRGLRSLVIVVTAFAWALPGPIIGIGLKEVIGRLPGGFLANLFYHGPSPLPLLWAYLVRFLPFAVVMLWPVVRLVPREPREAARLEGQGPWREFWTVVWPMTRPGVLLCALLVAALSLGEVAASTRVETPGWESFIKLLFDRMHNGVDNSVAALSVLLLGTIGGLGVVGMGWRQAITRKDKPVD